MLSVMAAVQRGSEQAAVRVAREEVVMAEDTDTEQHRQVAREGRQRARAGLPFILPDRVRSTKRPTERDPWETTPEQARKTNSERQAKARRVAAARRRRLLAGEDVEETPLDTPPPQSAAERALVDPARRTDTTRDALLERTVALEPAYVQLVRLARARNAKRGDFIEDYCRLLVRAGRSGRGVSRADLADLAASESYGWSVQWAYKLLHWSYRLFSEWCLEEHMKGHIFTEAEIAPIRVWVKSINDRTWEEPPLAPGDLSTDADDCG
jgi:hypothetical protein